MSYLEKYDILLEARTPVFIGDGKEIGKKEYAYDRRNNIIFFMNLSKLYSKLDEKGLLDKYEKFILSKGREDLYDFLRNNNIKLGDIERCSSAKIRVSNRDLLNNSTKGIATFVKDAYGLPYIPGTSLKGALRNILLNYEIADNGKRYGKTGSAIENAVKVISNQKNKQMILAREYKELTVAAFHTLHREETKDTDIVNDNLMGLAVSDSEPLAYDSLVLCPKIDYGTDGQEKSINILRECIAPGTKIKTTLTLNKKLCPYTIEDIQCAVKLFYQSYRERFLSKFKGYPDVFLADDLGVYLGGGVSFTSKTVLHSLYDHKKCVRLTSEIIDSTLPPRIRKEHKHYKDVEKGVSPHALKCTKVNGKLMQMGVCAWKADKSLG